MRKKECFSITISFIKLNQITHRPQLFSLCGLGAWPKCRHKKLCQPLFFLSFFLSSSLCPLSIDDLTSNPTFRKFALPQFEFAGGLVSGLENSRGEITLERPSRQWDYPFGWAPHQIIAWESLHRWGEVGFSSFLFSFTSPLPLTWNWQTNDKGHDQEKKTKKRQQIKQIFPQTTMAQRLAYKWLHMIAKSYVDFNGTVPEKYDVVAKSHL